MAEPLCGAAARSSSTQSTTIAETPALTHIPHLDSQKPQTNQSRRSHKEPGRLHRPQPRVRNLNTKAEASTRPPTLHKQQQTRNNTKRRASGTKHRRPEAVKSGVSQLVFNFRVSSLFLIWVLISTSNLCICTHHNGHPTKLYLTLSPPRYHLSNATLTIYTIREYYSHKSYIALRDPIQNHTLHNPIHYSLAPLNPSLLKSSTTKCHLSILSLAHTQCSPRTHYPLHPTFYKALLPPTALSPHVLPHPAHPHHTTQSTQQLVKKIALTTRKSQHLKKISNKNLYYLQAYLRHGAAAAADLHTLSLRRTCHPHTTTDHTLTHPVVPETLTSQTSDSLTLTSHCQTPKNTDSEYDTHNLDTLDTHIHDRSTHTPDFGTTSPQTKSASDLDPSLCHPKITQPIHKHDHYDPHNPNLAPNNNGANTPPKLPHT